MEMTRGSDPRGTATPTTVASSHPCEAPARQRRDARRLHHDRRAASGTVHFELALARRFIRSCLRALRRKAARCTRDHRRMEGNHCRHRRVDRHFQDPRGKPENFRCPGHHRVLPERNRLPTRLRLSGLRFRNDIHPRTGPHRPPPAGCTGRGRIPGSHGCLPPSRSAPPVPRLRAHHSLGAARGPSPPETAHSRIPRRRAVVLGIGVYALRNKMVGGFSGVNRGCESSQRVPDRAFRPQDDCGVPRRLAPMRMRQRRRRFFLR